VLITIGKDSTLRIWDLVSAKCALTTKLSTGTRMLVALSVVTCVISFVGFCSAASLCLWSPDGAHYALVSGSRVDVHSLAASDASSTELLQESPILSCAFLSDSVIATGGADGVVRSNISSIV
jgi:WD40 repeat protein